MAGAAVGVGGRLTTPPKLCSRPAVSLAPAFAAPVKGALGGRPAAFGGGLSLFVPLGLPVVPFSPA